MTSFTWTSSNGSWDTGTNWNTGSAPDSFSADATIAAPGTYTVSILGGQSFELDSLTLSDQGANLDLAGTLDLSGGSGNVIDDLLGSYFPYGAGTIDLDGGTLFGATTLTALVETTTTGTIDGSAGRLTTNENGNLEADSGGVLLIDTAGTFDSDGYITASSGTVVVNPQTDAIVIGGSALVGDNVYLVENGTVDFGGSRTANLTTITTNAPDDEDIIHLIGSGALMAGWNGSAYVPIQQTLGSIGASAQLLLTVGQDFRDPNTLTVDGTVGVGNATLAAASLVVNPDGTLAGLGASGTPGLVSGPVDNDGTILVSGSIEIANAITGSGVITFASGDGNVLQLDNLSEANALAGFGAGDAILLSGVTADAASWSAGTLTISDAGTPVERLSLPGDYGSAQFFANTGSAGATITVVCFAAGTRIAADRGEVAVEVLRQGDLARTLGGRLRPVAWIGRREVDCTRHPQPKRVWPILIRAGAFAPGVPSRDLRVSPQHAIFAEGVLIPARYLVNGRTVVQEPLPRIVYYHVELDSHDVLLAEALPCESYLDTGDRAAFENGGRALTLHPDFSRWAWDARACADLKVVGAEVERVKAQLAARADHLLASVSCQRARKNRGRPSGDGVKSRSFLKA